jgi:uncharacterized protein YfaS (alpha-2-macroglobulin family)
MLVNGETSFSFNTGDLTGQFKVIVQGVTDRGVVYGEKEITVRTNKKGPDCLIGTFLLSNLTF